MEIKQYLSAKGFEYTVKHRPSGENAIMNCPFCGDDTKQKFAINLHTGAFKCMRENHCGVQGSWTDFQKKLGDKPIRLSHWISNKGTIFIPQQKKEYVKPKATVKKPASKVLEYLKSREFSDKTIKFFKIGEKDGAIAFPYFKNKKLVNVKYRTLDKKIWSEKGTESTLFNRDNITDDEQILVVTEGEWDCLALHEYGIDSVSIPNGANDFRWVENEWEWLERFKGIYICYDNDAAGHAGAEILAQKIGAWKCKRVILPEKDANECLKKKVSVDVMLECIDGAIDFQPELLVSPAFFASAISDLIENPKMLNGMATAWKKLDNILGGWRMSELTIWSGQSGSGKSTILNQQILDFAKHDVRVCVASLEMHPTRYLRWLLLQYTGRQFPSRREVMEALSWLSEKLYIINSVEVMDVETLLDIFEYAARRYNVKHFVIDSLMRMKIEGADKWDAQKDFVTKLLTFSKKFQVHVHLVAHSRKTATDSDRPDKSDVKGSGDITDLAHNVLVMWRAGEQEDCDSLIFVKKNREMGIIDNVGLYFNPATKLFYDSKEERDAKITGS